MVTNFFIILALFMLYNQLASPRICAGTRKKRKWTNESNTWEKYGMCIRIIKYYLNK